jgi:etoposide-induced 2.4 mRNA
LLQTVLSYLIPVIGPLASFIHLSWLYALYCFEYKWSLAGWSLEKRLVHLEENWYVVSLSDPSAALLLWSDIVKQGILCRVWKSIHIGNFFRAKFCIQGDFCLTFSCGMYILF